MKPVVFAFDAYGTLFDVHAAVARHRDAIGPKADRLSDLWRQKQLEYAWVRSLAGVYRDFWACTEAALDFAGAEIGGLSAGTRAALLSAYETLDAFPDAAPALTALRAKGIKTAILSNGTRTMLDSAIVAAGLDSLVDAVLSVDVVGVYKTHPAAYALVTEAFACMPGAVSFQSSNRWDIFGALNFGFRSIWINRGGRPNEYGDRQPERILRSLDGLADFD